MKLLIVGSRSISDFDIGAVVPGETELIITGGACGVDALAEAFADAKGISKLILRPNYKKYGKGAPLVRNREMVDLCDKAVIIWDKKSRGTKYTIDYAKKQDKDVLFIVISKSEKSNG